MGVKRLIIANVAVYAALKIAWITLPEIPSDFEQLLTWLALPSSPAMLATRPWTLLTYAFVQVDFLHLLVNMLWLGWFGSLLASSKSPGEVVKIYCAGALAGAVFFIAQSALTGDISSQLTGASASVGAIVAATTMLMPRHEVKLVIPGSLPLWCVAPVAFISFFTGPETTLWAHIGGILTGVAFFLVWRRSVRRVSGKIRKKMAGRIAKVDLLEKARTSGFSSLTDDERLQLFDIADSAAHKPQPRHR